MNAIDIKVNELLFEVEVDRIIGKVLDGCDSPEDRKRYHEEIMTYGCEMGVPNLTYSRDIEKVYEAHKDYIDFLWKASGQEHTTNREYRDVATFFAFEYTVTQLHERGNQ